METSRDNIMVEARGADASAASAHPTGEEARQGTTGHNVRYVLTISLGGVLIALAAAWFLVA